MLHNTHYEFVIPNAVGTTPIKKMPAKDAYILLEGNAIAFIVDKKYGREFIEYMHAFLDSVCLPEVAAAEYKQTLVDRMLQQQKHEEMQQRIQEQLAAAVKKEAAPPPVKPKTQLEQMQEAAAKAREADAAGTLGLPPPDPFEGVKLLDTDSSGMPEPTGPLPTGDLFAAMKEAAERASGE